MTESYFLENSHRLLWVDTDNRHIISMKSRGFPQTPQDIMAEYNGCSVPQYTAYPLLKHSTIHSGDERLHECSLVTLRTKYEQNLHHLQARILE